jgi:REP element-mobilizing transposase RayT
MQGGLIMPRIQRLPAIPFGWYYIVLYAESGRNLVTDDAEQELFLELLQKTLRRMGARLHAACVTPKEVHLAIQSGERSVREITRSLCHDYALRLNRKYFARGRLFRAHPYVLLIQHGSWLVPLVHVIHWIPQLRKLASADGERYWSSDEAYRGRTRRQGITTHVVLHIVSHGARRRDAQTDAYCRLLMTPPGAEHLRLLSSGSQEDSRILGDAEFLAEIWRLTHQKPPRQRQAAPVIGLLRRAVTDAVAKFGAMCDVALSDGQARAWKRRVTPEQLCSRSRKRPLPTIRVLIASHAISHQKATRAQAARFFGCRPETLSADRRRRAEALFVEWFGITSTALFSAGRSGD